MKTVDFKQLEKICITLYENFNSFTKKKLDISKDFA